MHLEIVSSNPSAAIEPLKQLARKVDAALPPPARTI